MEQLIIEISEILKDYRADERNFLGLNHSVTPERIKTWINQFDTSIQVNILKELKNIFEKRYVSKKDAKKFLKSGIEFLKKHLKYNTIEELLNNTVFLKLQPDNKSQSKLLELLKEVLKDEYSYSYDNLGCVSTTNYVYLDDILCTGNTLYNDIKGWLQKDDMKETIKSNNKKLIFLYIFIHTKNYHKKKAQFRYNVDNLIDNYTTMIRAIEIDNSDNGAMEIVKPLEEGQSQNVIDYKNQIEERANIRAENAGYRPYPNEFYRNPNIPLQEKFFTSPENRKIFENAILEKGIEILNSVESNIPNMRALGYSLPSYKDFGFGTLAFTWRSIPNNTPLVFWYDSPNFTPLFDRRSTWGNDDLNDILEDIF